jgi:hypothetical protein
VFRPKEPDVEAAENLDPLTGRGRHVACEGRRAWERATGYGRREAAEWTHSRWKRVFGGALRSRSLDAQRAEATIAAGALNRMAELGMPRAVRVALADLLNFDFGPPSLLQQSPRRATPEPQVALTSPGRLGPSAGVTSLHGLRTRLPSPMLPLWIA